MANVLLLRTPSDPAKDKYEFAFKSEGYNPISIPVLETVLVNLPDLQDIIREGVESRGYDGVIITSARACEAWREVVEGLRDDAGDADWTQIPFYVVGEATSAALSDIQNIPRIHRLAPHNIRGGIDSGTSEKLAHYILDDLPVPDSGRMRKLLYLTGDKNRDTLPSILSAGDVELENLKVYETRGSSKFGDNLRHRLNTVPPELQTWWIIYFAPSSADFVTPVLTEHFALVSVKSSRPTDDIRFRDVHVAAIGPTTSTYLRDTLHIRVDVIAPKPSAEALLGSIKEFNSRNPSL